MSYVKFHLYNFIDYWGSDSTIECKEKSLRRINLINLQYSSWMIEIKSLFFNTESYKKLKNEGGFELTHIARIKKINNNSFNNHEVIELLVGLNYFFSFIVGDWCPPTLPVGYDDNNNAVWHNYSTPKLYWSHRFSCFDPNKTNCIKDFFPLFMEKIKEKSWKKTFYNVLYWYINSNASFPAINPCVGIILTLSALERFSFEYLVKEQKLMNENKWDRKNYFDKVSELLNCLKIPTAIPDRIKSINKYGSDAPDILSKIRNSLIHPRKAHNYNDNDYNNAWHLGQWLLELVILAICGYNGEYSNRITKEYHGQIEMVPWAKTQEKTSP